MSSAPPPTSSSSQQQQHHTREGEVSVAKEEEEGSGTELTTPSARIELPPLRQEAHIHQLGHQQRGQSSLSYLGYPQHQPAQHPPSGLPNFSFGRPAPPSRSTLVPPASTSSLYPPAPAPSRTSAFLSLGPVGSPLLIGQQTSSNPGPVSLLPQRPNGPTSANAGEAIEPPPPTSRRTRPSTTNYADDEHDDNPEDEEELPSGPEDDDDGSDFSAPHRRTSPRRKTSSASKGKGKQKEDPALPPPPPYALTEKPLVKKKRGKWDPKPSDESEPELPVATKGKGKAPATRPRAVSGGPGPTVLVSVAGKPGAPKLPPVGLVGSTRKVDDLPKG